MNIRKIICKFLSIIILYSCLTTTGFGTPIAIPSTDDNTDTFQALAKRSLQELNDLGESAYQAGDYEKALPFFMIICSRYDETDNTDNQYIYTKAFIRNGNIRYQATAYASAMDAYLKAMRIAEAYRFDDLIGVTYGHIGNIYAANNDFESAVTAYKRALPYAYEFDNENLRYMALNNLVGAYYFKGEIDSAEHYFHLFKALDIQAPWILYDVFLNQAFIFSGRAHIDSAKIYAKKAARQATENDLPMTSIGACNSCIAQFFEQENQLDSTLFYLHENENIARETQSYDLLIATVRDLGHIYDKVGVTDKALQYKSEYLALSDSILSQNAFNEMKNKQVFYELERNASTINRLNTIHILQRNGILVLSIAILVFIALIIILYLQKQKLKAAWIELYERNRRQLSDEIRYKQQIHSLEQSLENAQIKISALAALATNASEINGTDDTGNGRKAIIGQAQRDQIAHDILHVMETTEDYCACDYSIDKLASAIDSNARYVSETINEVFGKNFRALLNEYRIKKAMARLSDTEHYSHLTIKAIAESVGYKSQATFITAFTKFTGLKPGLYQKLALERHKKEKAD